MATPRAGTKFSAPVAHAPGHVTVDLDCYRDGQKIESLSLDGRKQSFKVGRGKDCAIVLKHPSLSRHHAEFTIQGHHVFVTDTGSSHGTYVDGKRLPSQQPTLMNTGAEAWFGGSSRRYRVARVMVPQGGGAGPQYDSLEDEAKNRRNDELARAFKHLLKPGHTGIDIAPDGFVKVSDVISSGAMTNYRASEQEVVEMVMVVPALFEIFDHAERGLLIRERLLGDETLAPLVEVPQATVLGFAALVYWGLFGEINIVRSEGLKAMPRHPITFMPRNPQPTDKIPCTTTKPQIAVRLDVERAISQGMKFFWTGENQEQVVCAGDHQNIVRPSMFETVVNAKDGSCLMAKEDIERLREEEAKAAEAHAAAQAKIAAKKEADIVRGIEEGKEAIYRQTGEVVIVSKAHYDDIAPYFTVTMPDGREKQTTSERLDPLTVLDMRDKDKPKSPKLKAKIVNNPILANVPAMEFDNSRRRKRLKI